MPKSLCCYPVLIKKMPPSGQQELFMLCTPEYKEKLFIQAFLDLFPSQYQPHVGDIERLANKRTRRLYVTLPNSYE